MREIKFRGFHANENGNTVITVNGKDYKGEWVYGCLLTGFFLRGGQDIPYIMTADGTDYDCFEDIQEGNGIYEVLPETVSQYTGLPDKNGKEIYEGDILNEDGYLFTVTFDKKWAKFKLKHDEKAFQFPEWNRGVLMEIIGNIFDNPELLESEATK